MYALHKLGMRMREIVESLKQINGGKLPDGCSYPNLSKAITVDWREDKFKKKSKKTPPGTKTWQAAIHYLDTFLESKFQYTFNAVKNEYQHPAGKSIPLIEIMESGSQDDFPELSVPHEKWGIKGIRKRVTSSLLEEIFRSVKKEIRILSTYISYLAKLEPVLWEVLERGVRLKFMILHPVSESAALRQKGIRAGQNDIDLESEIRRNIRLIENLRKQYPDQVEYRLLNEQVGMQLYCWDNWMLRGNFYYAFESDLKPLEELESNSVLYEAANEHWHNLWSHYDDIHWQKAIRYTCHFLKKDMIENFILEINQSTNNIRISRTNSEDTFFGSIRFLNDQYCSISFGTDITAYNSTRIGHLLVYTGNRKVLNISTTLGGIFNVHHEDFIYGSIVVFQKMEQNVDQAIPVSTQLKEFFKLREALSFLQCKPGDLDKLKDMLEDNSNPDK